MRMSSILQSHLVASLVILAGLVRADDVANLVSNPSFENATPNNLPEGWRGDRAVYSTDTTIARNGKVSLKFAGNDPKRYVLCTQKLSLQPGWKVRISAWVRTKDLIGPESGATICLEWTDRSGKWLGGVYPGGVQGTRDWTRVEAVTRIPENAGTFNLCCYARRGMTGEAWFDDVEVVRVIDPPMTSTVLWPNYRGQIPADSSGKVMTRVRLNLVDQPFKPDQLQIEATIRRAGTAKPVAQETVRPRLSPQPTDMALPMSGLSPGTYQLTLRLLDPAGKELQADRHELIQLAHDAALTSTIDKHHRLLIDGKPFFPLGMYWHAINEKDLKLYADSKFNCIMPYGSPTQEQLDLALQHKMKVIYSVKDWYFGIKSCPTFIKSAEDEEPAVRQRVRQFRDHPAVIAWYLNDELGEEYMPRLEAHQRWVAQEDPNHPTWIVLYQVDQVRAYLKTFDVIGTDPYPIGRKPASLAAQWTARTFDQTERSRPMWQVPQVFNWGNYGKNDADAANGRTPTPAEMRSMSWQCICEGATGLVFYSWYDLKRNADVPFEKQWNALKTIAAEIDRFAPIVLSIEPTPSVSLEGERPAWLHWIVRGSSGKVYIIAANDGDGEGTVSFKLPPGSRSIREMTGGRDIFIREAGFADELPKLAVRLYEIALD
ncbi:MAG: hypothetical protein ACHRHE_20215 [Tepidisphaerales bacterium]